MTTETERTYQVVATVIRPGSGRQIPVFYLDAHVQGIVSADHARRVADGILNPFDDPNTYIFATVRCVQTGEYAETTPSADQLKVMSGAAV